MRFKSLTAIFAALLFSSNAACDSFCGFDEGLIGTKAIGYVSPNHLKTHQYAEHLCELKAYVEASDTAEAAVISCPDFQNIPNANAHFNQEGFDPITYGYFQLLAFDAKDDWVKVALKSGEKKWVRQSKPNSDGFPYHYNQGQPAEMLYATRPKQSGIYDEPRLDRPAAHMGVFFRQITDVWIDRKVPLDFFNQETFKTLEKYGLFNPDHIEQGTLAAHYGRFLGVGYDVKSIVRDADGREWLKTEAFLEIAGYNLDAYVAEKLEEQGITLPAKDLYRLYYDEAAAKRGATGQSIYFPYREPSGTITMVMTSGLGCD